MFCGSPVKARSELHVGLRMARARRNVNADDVLARIFHGFEAFIAKLHARLVFVAWTKRAAALDTSGIGW